jgi:hypothetical protein
MKLKCVGGLKFLKILTDEPMTVNIFLLLKVDGGIRWGWDISLRVIDFLVAYFPLKRPDSFPLIIS